jgi:hypothetical protein
VLDRGRTPLAGGGVMGVNTGHAGHNVQADPTFDPRGVTVTIKGPVLNETFTHSAGESWKWDEPALAAARTRIDVAVKRFEGLALKPGTLVRLTPPDRNVSRFERLTYGDYVVIHDPWTEAGDYIGDSTEAKHADWTCVPVVAVIDTDKETSLDGFMRFWGDKTAIHFANADDLALVPRG